MLSAITIYSLGRTILDSSEKLKQPLLSKDPEEHKIIEETEGNCEQCEIEKMKKPCNICED